MVHGGAELIDEQGITTGRLPSRDTEERREGSREAIRRLFRGNDIICSSVMIRRSVLEALGGFRQEFVPGEDWEMWLRIAAHHDIVYLGWPLALRRSHGESLTSHFTVDSVAASHELILDSLFAKTRGLSGDAALRRYAHAANERTLAGLAARLGVREDFTRYLMSSLRRQHSIAFESRTWATLLEGAPLFAPSPLYQAARGIWRRRPA
jgi:hypothetical protein